MIARDSTPSGPINVPELGGIVVELVVDEDGALSWLTTAAVPARTATRSTSTTDHDHGRR
jgi:hypothetical protein